MMRKHSKSSKDKLENVQTAAAASSLIDPTTATESITVPCTTTATTISTIASAAALSPSSPESEGQSSSLPGLAGTSSMATTTSSFISDEPIPPPSPFDQPSTSRDFPFKVCHKNFFFSLLVFIKIKKYSF